MTQLALILFAVLFVSTSDAATQADDAPKCVEIRRLDGGRLAYYHWAGRGPSLLLIPGSWSDYRQFDKVRENLDPSLYLNLVIVELPGHGRSWPPVLGGSIESFAKEILRLVDMLDWNSWYAGGHSIGGMIAIELAGRRTDQVAGVISLEGWSHHRVLNDAFDGRVYNTLCGEREKERQEARARAWPAHNRADPGLSHNLEALGRRADPAILTGARAGGVGRSKSACAGSENHADSGAPHD